MVQLSNALARSNGFEEMANEASHAGNCLGGNDVIRGYQP